MLALTRQRPDVQAAEALLHQASAQIGVPHHPLHGLSQGGDRAERTEERATLERLDDLRHRAAQRRAPDGAELTLPLGMLSPPPSG